MGIKTSGQTGNSYHVNGAYFGAQDNGGWSGSIGSANNNFVEGSRSEAFLNTGATLGSPYGAVSVASEVAGVQYLYMIGNESEVDDKYANATSSFSPTNFSASYVATNGNGNVSHEKKSDAAFMANPYSNTPFIHGFFVPRGGNYAIGSGAGYQSTSYAAFEDDDVDTWAVQLEYAITSNALGIPNNAAIRGCKQYTTTVCDNGNMNLLYVGTDNTFRIGADTGLAAVHLGSSGVQTYIDGVLNAEGTIYVAGNPNNYWNGTIFDLRQRRRHYVSRISP